MTEDQRYRQVEILQVKVRHHHKLIQSLSEKWKAAERSGRTARARGFRVTYEQRLREYLPLLDRLLQAYAAFGASLQAAGDDVTRIGLRQCVLVHHEQRQETERTLHELSEPTPALAS